MGREYERISSFPISNSERSEMRAILDEMKQRWATIKEPTLLQRVHRNQVNRKCEQVKKSQSQATKDGLNRNFLIARESIKLEVQPIRSEVKCSGCLLCGKPTLNCYCSAECKDLDRR